MATIAELADYDAIIVGTPTRFGRISSQMAAFLEQAFRLTPEMRLLPAITPPLQLDANFVVNLACSAR